MNVIDFKSLERDAGGKEARLAQRFGAGRRAYGQRTAQPWEPWSDHQFRGNRSRRAAAPLNAGVREASSNSAPTNRLADCSEKWNG